MFCRAYNIRHFDGSAVVEIEVDQIEKRAWGSKRNGRRFDKKKRSVNSAGRCLYKGMLLKNTVLMNAESFTKN